MIRTEHVEEIWRRCHGRLLGFIRSKVPNPEDAEDILQEVFLRIHTRLCCMQEWMLMERLIYHITRNIIIDQYRKNRSTDEIDDQIVAEYGIPEMEDDPATALAFSLREMVDKLPKLHREALVMTEYEGFTQAALADREGISLSAAKSRVQRARAKLKQALLECCHFELDTLGRIINYHKRCCCCAPFLEPRAAVR